jgi:hypothetical protein
MFMPDIAAASGEPVHATVSAATIWKANEADSSVATRVRSMTGVRVNGLCGLYSTLSDGRSELSAKRRKGRPAFP